MKRQKKTLEVTRDVKTEILDKLAHAIFKIRGGFPEKNKLASVASALVLKYPCLRDKDSIMGCDAWLTLGQTVMPETSGQNCVKQAAMR